jgi:hypothetical protein
MIWSVYRKDPNIQKLIASGGASALITDGLLDSNAAGENVVGDALETGGKKMAKSQATAAARDLVQGDGAGAVASLEGGLADAPFKFGHLLLGGLQETKTGKRISCLLSLGRKLVAEAAILGSLFASPPGEETWRKVLNTISMAWGALGAIIATFTCEHVPDARADPAASPLFRLLQNTLTTLCCAAMLLQSSTLHARKRTAISPAPSMPTSMKPSPARS